MNIQSLAIIEDDEKVRNYLTEQIQAYTNIPQVLSFSDGEAALSALTKNAVDIAMFDVQLPGIDGIECTKRLKMVHPRMQIMMLTVYDDTETIFSALKAGASSYMLKSTPPEKIIEAIAELHSGGSPISSQIARKVIEAFTVKEKVNEYFQELSRREQEMLELLSKGFRYKEIADKLFLSVETVRTHIRNVYEKLQVNCRIEALKKTGLL
ncbi:response regulator transcription factor [Ferruginibacter lapsinanis]|uniref:response regulator transcription factor n=1 Tax=Ferruginibacter lapsinanis TaxID=563172 RepID=UPI001E49412A|nr:response regulator transcription factor [Ferruginibacter lapsinanis]UEG49190.1 response regulator transcription factor [Ferruginibacter lapsinanis]